MNRKSFLKSSFLIGGGLLLGLSGKATQPTYKIDKSKFGYNGEEWEAWFIRGELKDKQFIVPPKTMIYVLPSSHVERCDFITKQNTERDKNWCITVMKGTENAPTTFIKNTVGFKTLN